MVDLQRSIIVVALGIAVFFGAANPGRAADRQVLQGHIPEVVSHLQPIGRLPATDRLNLAIGLPLRNEQHWMICSSKSTIRPARIFINI